MTEPDSEKRIELTDEEKDDQVETETIEFTEELGKAKLLKDIKFDEKKIEKLESHEVEDILELSKEDWKEKFGVDEGILYFNRISRFKVKTLLIKKIGKTWNKKRKRTN